MATARPAVMEQLNPTRARKTTARKQPDLVVRTARELMLQYPKLREPVIDGLLRVGETANVIAPPKLGKSWLALQMALSIVTGRAWFNCAVASGKVLIIDNELHAETLAHRIPKVANAMGLATDDFGDQLNAISLRGQLVTLDRMLAIFKTFKRGELRLVIIDALYRTLPAGTDENDNGAMANVYNMIDHYADEMGVGFVLIHHASKGIQTNKAVTDVGAGAGAQSRATDSHIVLRAHEQPGAVVLDAASRSFPPLEARCLRWDFPLWQLAPDLDPLKLKADRPKTGRGGRPPADDADVKQGWTVERFIAEFFPNKKPKTIDQVYVATTRNKLSERLVGRLLKAAEAEGCLHRWYEGSNVPIRFSTAPHKNGLFKEEQN